jgi:hypothetical protein
LRTELLVVDEDSGAPDAVAGALVVVVGGAVVVVVVGSGRA